MFADDKTNQQRATQFDLLIEECTPELRARLLTAVDTLKASGQNIGELAAKVTVFQHEWPVVLVIRHQHRAVPYVLPLDVGL